MSPFQREPRLTIKELRSIIEFYHGHFPTWKVIRKDTLVREDGPIVQGITFERLSGGQYRPTGHIRVLVAPEDFWGMDLSQPLNVKLRQIERRRDTPEIRERVVQAMYAEFLPRVDQPLIAEQVLNFYEDSAYPVSHQAYSLAPLNAYLGHDERALHWCSRFTELVNASGNPWQELEQKQLAFLDELEKWLKAGDAKQQLERVLQDERRKWGLT